MILVGGVLPGVPNEKLKIINLHIFAIYYKPRRTIVRLRLIINNKNAHLNNFKHFINDIDIKYKLRRTIVRLHLVINIQNPNFNNFNQFIKITNIID